MATLKFENHDPPQSSQKPGPWAAYVATHRFPSDVRWTVVGGARVVSGAEKKII